MSNITKFTPEEVTLLKNTICPPNTTDAELKVFMAVCERKKLDPFQRQIYLTKRWDKNQNKEVMTILTSIDGFRAVAARSGEYAGCDDVVFDSELLPKKATVTVYRIVKGVRFPWTASARWDQFCPDTPKKDFMWRKMPHVMLGKVAEAHALRKAFPEDLSDLYTDDEMAQAEKDVKPLVDIKTITPEKIEYEKEKTLVQLQNIIDRTKESGTPQGKQEQVKEISQEEQLEIKQWRDHISNIFLRAPTSPFRDNPKAAAQFTQNETGKALKDLNAAEMEDLELRFLKKYPEAQFVAQEELDKARPF